MTGFSSFVLVTKHFYLVCISMYKKYIAIFLLGLISSTVNSNKVMYEFFSRIKVLGICLPLNDLSFCHAR